MGAGLAAWTIYLLQDGFNWWAVLTGVFAVTMWIGVALFFILDSDSYELLLQGLTPAERAKQEWKQEQLKQQRAEEREKRKEALMRKRGGASAVFTAYTGTLIDKLTQRQFAFSHEWVAP